MVSMFTTAGSTRLAISAKEADRASGAREICASPWATVGLPESIAPDSDSRQQAGRSKGYDPDPKLSQNGPLVNCCLIVGKLEHKHHLR